MSTDPNWIAVYSGKVRELYRLETHPGVLLMVATDRVSAFDYILEPEIPGKGNVLTEITDWWFAQFPTVPNHLIDATSLAEIEPLVPERFQGRSMLVRSLKMFPIECVVRGYLAGSAWAEYQESSTACGHALPGGLSFGDKLPEPIYTPAFKAPVGEHDENISFERTVELVGFEVAVKLRDLSLQVYTEAASIAEQKRLLLADTKFEFGVDDKGVIRLADEVLTSDSSRYWDEGSWRDGMRKESFDKQIVRDWLAANWDRTGHPPRLPDHIVLETAKRYRELQTRLTE